MTNKPILCLDFDGVIHSYTSGWQGADVIPDAPVAGALSFLMNAIEHFDVQIFSSRTGQSFGTSAMQNWLKRHMMTHCPTGTAHAVLDAITWPTTKPPAMVTIDDRALTFTGEWPSIDSLRGFQPWNKPQGQNRATRFDRAARAIWPCIGCDHTYDEALLDEKMQASIAYCHDMVEAVLEVV